MQVRTPKHAAKCWNIKNIIWKNDWWFIVKEKIWTVYLGWRSFSHWTHSTKLISYSTENQQAGREGQPKWEDKCHEQLCDRSCPQNTRGALWKALVFSYQHKKPTLWCMQLHYEYKNEIKAVDSYIKTNSKMYHQHLNAQPEILVDRYMF